MLHMVPNSGDTYGPYEIFQWPVPAGKLQMRHAYFFVALFPLYKNGHNLISFREDFTNCQCFGYCESTWK